MYTIALIKFPDSLCSPVALVMGWLRTPTIQPQREQVLPSAVCSSKGSSRVFDTTVLIRPLSSEDMVRYRLEALRQQGLLQWNGCYLEPKAPVARVRDGGTVAELIVNERR
ncbi:MAG: hypothetical protein RMK00_09285 [Bacteroidota bacterium]|nr:hypothetical protein [Bacteroidota bacterium]